MMANQCSKNKTFIFTSFIEQQFTQKSHLRTLSKEKNCKINTLNLCYKKQGIKSSTKSRTGLCCGSSSQESVGGMMMMWPLPGGNPLNSPESIPHCSRIKVFLCTGRCTFAYEAVGAKTSSAKSTLWIILELQVLHRSVARAEIR